MAKQKKVVKKKSEDEKHVLVSIVSGKIRMKDIVYLIEKYEIVKVTEKDIKDVTLAMELLSRDMAKNKLGQ
jgi:hypothetical protein